MSSRIWKQVTQCLCLYLCILLAWPAYAQEETAVAAAEVIAPLPTPTPVPAPPAVAEEPTSTALEGTTEEPTPEAPATEPPATEPPAETTAAPTGPSATPPATATVSPGATASVAPTATDTATVTPAPSNSPTPAPSAAPGWDESKCDHRNEHCERAPKCAIEGCAHVGIDEQGNPKALCPLGQWLLDASVSANEPGAALLSASTPTEIALKNGMNTLYRSGSYVLTGGGAGAEVVVGKNLAVSIVLKDAQLLRLTLSEGVACTLGFEEQNAVTSLAAPNAELTINGIGSLVVSTNFNCPRLTVLGGSVRLPSYTGADEIISLNGRKPYPFYASGALSATLEGQFLCELRPNAADQAAVLWLPPLEDQLPYYSKLENQTLVLTAIPAPPGKAVEFSLTGSDAFAPMENTDYRIVPGDQPQSKQLTIAKNGVSVTMSGIGEASYAPSVIAQAPATLFFQKQNVLGELNGSAGVTLSGSGSLSVQTLGVPALKAVGTLSISCGAVAGTALDRWQVVSVDADLALGTIASYNGQKASLCFLTGDLRTAYVPIAAPAPGYRYVGTLKGKTLKVEALPSSAALGTLGTTALTLSSGNYLLRSAPSATGDVVIPAGESVLLTLEDVQTTGRLVLEAGASATLTLTGANGFAGQTALGAKAKLTIDGTGALRFGAMTGEKGSSTTLGEQVSVTLATGDALAGSKLKPTLIRVTNNQNAPMAKTAITLKLGKDEPFSTTTDEQGLLMLWRGKALTGVNAVVLSAADTYATLITNGKADPDALPKISNLREYYNAALFDAPGALTLGIQYYVGSKVRDMPDTWVADAKTAPMQYGECNIPGIQKGDVVTYRAFASLKQGKLGQDTADAFAFGEQRSFTAIEPRRKLVIKDQQKTYDAKEFKLKSELYPQGATVAYYLKDTLLEHPPKDVGVYAAKVSVPAGDDAYLPGVYSVTMEIKRIVVLIYPEEVSKIQGQPDPEFPYTYQDTVMLGEDAVTGTLIRVAGEAYGNYAYLPDRLTAPSYYELVVDLYSPAFFVDWGPHHYLPYDPFAKIDPVYDTLRFSDGSTLRTQIRTNEILKLGSTYYGSPVSDMTDHTVRPATPTLRLRGGYDDAMLILTAEPELGKDGGYQTDADGNVVVHGRKLTLNYFMLNRLAAQHVNYLTFSLAGVSVMLPLDNLRPGGTVDEVLASNDVKRTGTSFCITLEPVSAGGLQAEESSAGDAIIAGDMLMRVGAYLQNGDTQLDISGVLKGARVMFDASGLLDGSAATTDTGDITETVAGKQVPAATAAPQPTALTQEETAAIAGAKGERETTGELLEVAQLLLQKQIERFGYALWHYGERAEMLDSFAVVPYTTSESQRAAFRALLRTKPYLTTPFYQSGLYGLSATAR